jgi:hypothetical protein
MINPSEIQEGLPVVFRRVDGIERLTRIAGPAILVSQAWMVPLELGVGLFTVSSLRWPTAQELAAGDWARPASRGDGLAVMVSVNDRAPARLVERAVHMARLAARSATVRVGAGPGDEAVEAAVRENGRVEVFVPLNGYRGRSTTAPEVALVPTLVCSREAERRVATLHPRWGVLDSLSRSLATALVVQLLGRDLRSPAALALLAEQRDIDPSSPAALVGPLGEEENVPVFNLSRGEAWQLAGEHPLLNADGA